MSPSSPLQYRPRAPASSTLPRWRLTALAVLTMLVVGHPSCTLTRVGAACASTEECRAEFGPGLVCADSGLCETAPVEPTCQNQVPADLLLSPSKYKNYVVLGSLLRATGKEGARQDAAELALESANRFLERQTEFPELEELRFGMVQCDHDGDTEEVARLAVHLSDTLRVPAIVGPASSSRTVTAFQRVNGSLVNTDPAPAAAASRSASPAPALFISPSATSVALTDLDQHMAGLLWRTAPTDDVQGRLMGAYAVERNERFVALYEDTAYGRGLYQELQAAAGALCDDCGIAFLADTPDLIPLTRALASNEAVQALADADLVFFMGAQESHIREMLDRMDGPQLAAKTVFFSDAAASTDTVSAVSTESFSRVLGTRASPPADTEALRFFTSAYEGRQEESPLLHSFTANSYDATWLILLAAMSAVLDGESVTPFSLADALTKMSDPTWSELGPSRCPLELVNDFCPPVPLDLGTIAAALEALRAGRDVDVAGASGQLDYCSNDEELERDTSSFEVWRLESTDQEEPAYRIVRAEDVQLATEPLEPCPE